MPLRLLELACDTPDQSGVRAEAWIVISRPRRSLSIAVIRATAPRAVSTRRGHLPPSQGGGLAVVP